MTTKIYSLHGQPGSTTDFAELSDLLEKKGLQIENLDSSQDLLLDKLGKNEKCMVIAYSWGGYRLLKSLKHLRDKVDQVVLIAPYLVADTPVSGFAKTLVNIPVIGSLMMNSYAKKNGPAFVSKTFYPEAVLHTGNWKRRQQELNSNANLWVSAVNSKYKMQGDPITAADASPIRGIAFIGDQDQSSDLSSQLKVLKNFPGIETQIIHGAGHGLLWTRTQQISEGILKFYER